MKNVPPILLAIGIFLFIYAFRPCTDDQHYLRRALGECFLLLYAVWVSAGNKVHHTIAVWGFILAVLALFDEVWGCASQFSNGEDILACGITAIFIVKLKSVLSCRKS